MIVLDTHVWIWWVHGSPALKTADLQALDAAIDEGLGVSVISCWEVAKLVERNRLRLPVGIEPWMRQALAHPGVRLLDFTPRVAIEATRLPQPFHRDPADQIIVATTRLHEATLATADTKILEYTQVRTLPIGT